MIKNIHNLYCPAPICIEDKESWSNGVWYSDEKICNSKEIKPMPSWIRMQQRIARVVKKENVGFFTLKMLQQNCIVGRAMSGLNSDRGNYEQQEKEWLKKHPVKKIMSEERKAILRERFEKVRVKA